SVIVGNCGVGFAPCRPQDREYLMFLMEGVEDIPQAALKAGLRWNWETFPDYLQALARTPLGLNVGAHISHAPLRVFAMGERGATDAEPSEAELGTMQQCVREAMQAGALGFDTGRTTMHRTPAWDPVPGTFAQPRELSAIASALRDFGSGVFEMVPYGGAGEDATGHEREFDWMIPLARDSRRPISLAMIQNLAYPDVWRDMLDRVEQARSQGARIVPQVAVRSVGVLLGFGIALSPLSLFPAAFDWIDKPLDQQRAALRDPRVRATLVASIAETSGDILGGMARLENVFPLANRGVLAYENHAENNVVAIGRRQGKHALEVVLDLIVDSDLTNFFIVPLFNSDIDAAGAMLVHPLTTIGLGDSGAHTSQTSDSGFPTFTLGYWVRHRNLLTLERAVQKLTSDLALLWGLRDRGMVRAGAYADLNVIDFDRLDLRLPEVRHDLPTGAAHLHQGAVGYEATIVNGVVLMREGLHTGAFPGRVLRNSQASY
ncbi:MAG: amidohydrolase family protein, partial [Deltaproteobacteria bacterium]|nr:amidohydrolase family protein [Deltaproteobacteria bacterium]